MANLIIKPTSGGSLILQDEGGTAANTIDASGNTQLAGTLGVTGAATLTGNSTVGGTLGVTGNSTVGGTLGVTGASTMTGNVTMAGTANNLGTVTVGNISNTAIVYPAGHVVRTSKIHQATNASITTTSTSSVASGILVSTPAVTGSNYNIIHFSCGAYIYANIIGNLQLYSNKNGAGYALNQGADSNSHGQHWNYSAHRHITGSWVDTAGLTAGTNIYQLYFKTASSTMYIVHNGNDYSLVVQEIQA